MTTASKPQVIAARMRFSDTGAYHAFTSANANDLRDMLYSGRISERDYAWGMLFWEWCCVRFSSRWQDRVYARGGMAACNRRIARINRLRLRLIESRFAYCMEN